MCENNINKRRKLRSIIIWVTVLFMLILNVGISVNLRDSGGCISVTFDKFPMLLVNKAVLCVDGKQYDISDSKLVRQIANESIVATNTDLCIHSKERWIDLYLGNLLVRRIYWEPEHDMFIVYKESLIHWIFFSFEGDGLVFPSDELIQSLESIIDNS